MSRYTYNTQFQPPAPLVHVTVRSPDLSAAIENLPAQVDTASDRTILPWEVAEGLGLQEIRALTVVGIGGVTITIPTFLAQVEIRGLRPLAVEVAASKGEPMVLLGRDVLNHFKIVLDGPQLKLEIS